MILNQDGTPYKPSGSLKQFDQTSTKYNLFNRFHSEMIKLGGSPIYYYEVLISTANIDKLYNEDRSKIFSPIPIVLYASYEPPQQSNMSGIFAVDVPDEEVLLLLNNSSTVKTIGHQPKVGSLIFTPHRSEYWIIIDRRLNQFNYWGLTTLELQCRKFQETSTNPPNIKTPPPDYKIS